jgi:hypothetical protein
MYSIVVLGLIAVVLLVGGRTREGLVATTTIKAPPYDQAEKDRIWGLLDNRTKSEFRTEAGGAQTEDAGKNLAAETVAGFFPIYSAATNQITSTQINNWVTGQSYTSSRRRDISKDLLKVYYKDQPAGTPTGTTTGTTTGGTTTGTTTGGTTTGGTTAGGTTTGTGTTTGGTTTGGTTTGTGTTAGTPSGTTTGSAAPAAGLYIRLKTEFDTKKAAYDALVVSASRSTSPSDADITRLRTMNRELFVLLEQTIEALSTIQTEDIASVNRELTATLNQLEQQYSILSENSDKVETLRRIREFEQVKSGGSVSILMIALLVLALAMLIIMMFSQRTNVPATAATMRPPSMANFT